MLMRCFSAIRQLHEGNGSGDLVLIIDHVAASASSVSRMDLANWRLL